MSNLQERSVKVCFGDEIRRFGFEGNSFSRLEEIIRSLFVMKTSMVVKYQDDEKDWITITSDKELEVAFQLSANGTLKVHVNPLEKEVSVQSPLYPQVIPAISPPEMPPQYPQGIPSQFPQGSPSQYPRNFGNCGKKLHKLKKLEHLDKKLNRLQMKALKYGTARLVEDVTVPNGTVIPPNNSFIKTWRIRNESTSVWQPEFLFLFKKGDCLSDVECVHLPKVVNPGEEVDISVPMKTPSSLGTYASIWRLSSGPSAKPFGQPFCVKIIVGDPSKPIPFEYCETQNYLTKINELVEMGFSDRTLDEKILKKCKGDMDRVVWKLLKKQQKLFLKQQKFVCKIEKYKRKAEANSC